MTNEDLAVAIQGGDTERVTELWDQTKGFIHQQAQHRARTLDGFGGVDADDLVQAGYFALVSAVESFDVNTGYKFTTWLSYHLRTEFARCAGYRTHSKKDAVDHAVDIDGVLPGTDDLTLEETLEDPSAQTDFDDLERKIWNDQLHAALMDALKDCTPDQRNAVVSHYFDGMTRSEIAAGCGVSGTMIEQREKRAFKTIRQHARRSGLDQFIDARTDFYHVGGDHAVEKLVLHREVLKREYYHGKD